MKCAVWTVALVCLLGSTLLPARAQSPSPRMAIASTPQIEPEELQSIEQAFEPLAPALDLRGANPSSGGEGEDPRALQGTESVMHATRPGSDPSRLPPGHLTAHEAAILGTVQDASAAPVPWCGAPHTPNAIHAALLRQRCNINPWCGYDAETAMECCRLQSKLAGYYPWGCQPGGCSDRCTFPTACPSCTGIPSSVPCHPASTCDGVIQR